MTNKQQKQKLVLLDAHAIIHRAYHALPDFTSTKGEPTGALYGVVSMFIKIAQDLKPDYFIACYDLPGPTHRHTAYTDYKAGRKKIDDALVLQLERSKDIFKAFNIPIYSEPGFEADDIIGTIIEKTKKDNSIDVVIASGDMDTLQLVSGKKVQVYTLKKGIKDTIIYDEDGVVERFGFKPPLLCDYKGLRGDPSDNIIGIEGIGEKSATEIIQKFGELEHVYKTIEKDRNKVEEAGIKKRVVDLLVAGKEEAMFSKMLACIRRDAPINFVLPDKHWQENINQDAVTDLFNELNFRTLSIRLKELLGESSSNHQVAMFTEQIDDKELKTTGIALWVLDSNITNPTIDDILNYSKKNTFAEAKDVIFQQLEKEDKAKVYEKIELPLVPIIKQMEDKGIKVDKTYLEKLSQDYHKKLEALEKDIWREAGEEFNINSPKQLGVILFDKLNLSAKNQKKTGTGAKSTRESELEKLRDMHPIINLVLQYREFAKLLSTYIDAIPKLLDNKSRLHTTFLQAGASTGRMSSNNPNLQNIPIKTELGRNIRNAFIAEKGHKLIALDYSQIELRVAAILSGDAKLVRIFKSGGDIHSAVASEVFGVPIDLVDKEMRRKAKVINFGILYGMGVNALKANLGTSRDDAQKFYDDYFKNFQGLADYLEKVKSDAGRQGYTETLFGRRRYFADLKSRLPYIRAAAERMAINAPIQGTAADILKIAMARIGEYLKKEKMENNAHLLLQVHDELVCEVKDEFVSKFAEDVKDIMENVVPLKETKDVPLVANVSLGDNWGEMEVITN